MVLDAKAALRIAGFFNLFHVKHYPGGRAPIDLNCRIVLRAKPI